MIEICTQNKHGFLELLGPGGVFPKWGQAWQSGRRGGTLVPGGSRERDH